MRRCGRIATGCGDEKRARSLIDAMFDDVEAYEDDLTRACSGIAHVRQATDGTQRRWIERVADACHNLGHHCMFWGWRDRRDARRLLGRAAQLRPFAPTFVMLARLCLAMADDRKRALAYLQQAAEDDRWHDLLRSEFQRAAELGALRQDPDFVAVALR